MHLGELDNPYDSIDPEDLLRESRWFDRPIDRKKVRKDAEERIALMRSTCASSANHPMKYPLCEGLEDDPFFKQFPALVELLARARQIDRLAMSLQHQFLMALNIVCSVALVFLVLFELFSHLPGIHGNWVVLLVGVVFLLGGSLWQWLYKAREKQLAYLQARCTAELLRILLFRTLNGIGDELSADIPERHYLPLSTVLPIVQNCEKDLNQVELPSKHAHGAVLPTIKFWEIDQLCYFHSAFQRNAVRAEVYKHLSRKLFGWGVIAMICLVALQGFINRLGPTHHPFWKPADYLLTVGPTMIVLAAIAEFYAGKRGFEVDAARYKNAHHIFLRKDLVAPPSQSDIKNEERNGRVTERALRISDIIAILAIGPMICAAVGGVLGKTPEPEGPYFDTFIISALILMALSIAIDFYTYQTAPNKEKENDEATRKKWIAGADSQKDTNVAAYRKHVEDIGGEALDELIDWYISSLDREVAIPKG